MGVWWCLGKLNIVSRIDTVHSTWNNHGPYGPSEWLLEREFFWKGSFRCCPPVQGISLACCNATVAEAVAALKDPTLEPILWTCPRRWNVETMTKLLSVAVCQMGIFHIGPNWTQNSSSQWLLGTARMISTQPHPIHIWKDSRSP